MSFSHFIGGTISLGGFTDTELNFSEEDFSNTSWIDRVDDLGLSRIFSEEESTGPTLNERQKRSIAPEIEGFEQKEPTDSQEESPSQVTLVDILRKIRKRPYFKKIFSNKIIRGINILRKASSSNPLKKILKDPLEKNMLVDAFIELEKILKKLEEEDPSNNILIQQLLDKISIQSINKLTNYITKFSKAAEGKLSPTFLFSLHNIIYRKNQITYEKSQKSENCRNPAIHLEVLKYQKVLVTIEASLESLLGLEQLKEIENISEEDIELIEKVVKQLADIVEENEEEEFLKTPAMQNIFGIFGSKEIIVNIDNYIRNYCFFEESIRESIPDFLSTLFQLLQKAQKVFIQSTFLRDEQNFPGASYRNLFSISHSIGKAYLSYKLPMDLDIPISPKDLADVLAHSFLAVLHHGRQIYSQTFFQKILNEIQSIPGDDIDFQEIFYLNFTNQFISQKNIMQLPKDLDRSLSEVLISVGTEYLTTYFSGEAEVSLKKTLPEKLAVILALIPEPSQKDFFCLIVTRFKEENELNKQSFYKDFSQNLTRYKLTPFISKISTIDADPAIKRFFTPPAERVFRELT